MKKLSISPKNCKFVVDKEKQIVVCILENTMRQFTDYVEENFPIVPWWMNFDCLSFESRLLMPKRFIGIARCAPEDEWNEDFAKRLAYSRMRAKFDKSFFKRANTYVRMLDTWADDAAENLNMLGARLSENNEHRKQYINNYLFPEEKK